MSTGSRESSFSYSESEDGEGDGEEPIMEAPEDSEESERDEEPDDDDEEDDGSDGIQYGMGQPFPAALEAVAELANMGGDIPDIRRLLDRVIARLGGQPVGRLDTLLLQVLLARVSLAEMQYQQQLQEALRVSLEESQEKPGGPPPALDQDIANLTTVTIAEEHLQCTDKQSCVVCLEAFRVGDTVRQLPCSHVFCDECILPWLRRHGTCPFCREEVKEVKKLDFLYDVCGFRQLDEGLCRCNSARLAVLPGCSHGFSPICMRANIWKSEPGPTPGQRVVRCPLCDKPSVVKASLLPQEYKPSAGRLGAAAGPSSHVNPLRNREPSDWNPAGAARGTDS
eukprot:RCo045115